MLEIEGQQFHRLIPPPPVHSKNLFRYSLADPMNFPCANYPEHVVLSGPNEEYRILEQRWCMHLWTNHVVSHDFGNSLLKSKKLQRKLRLNRKR